MNSELTKSLTALIDETLQELEELKKSRFAAAEIKIAGPGDDELAGQPSDGKLGKEEDKEEDKEEEEEEDKAEKADKDPMPLDEAIAKPKRPKKEQDEDAAAKKAKELMEKAEDEEDEEEEDEDEDHEEEEIKKSASQSTSLMKSMIDERVRPIEDKLSAIYDLVNQLADQPVAPKGFTARAVPLAKSANDTSAEPLSKGQLASKLFDLKKSGTPVDSLDIARVEMGQDLEQITRKYNIS